MNFTELNKRLQEVDDFDELTDEEKEVIETIIRVASMWILEAVRPSLMEAFQNLKDILRSLATQQVQLIDILRSLATQQTQDHRDDPREKELI